MTCFRAFLSAAFLLTTLPLARASAISDNFVSQCTSNLGNAKLCGCISRVTDEKIAFFGLRAVFYDQVNGDMEGANALYSRLPEDVKATAQRDIAAADAGVTGCRALFGNGKPNPFAKGQDSGVGEASDASNMKVVPLGKAIQQQ